MRLATFALTALTVLISPHSIRADSCELTVEEANLGVDPRDFAGSEVLIDVYRCTKKDTAVPLVVFACGGGVPKALYTTFASALAEKGYVVATIEHPVSFSPFAPPFNFANAVDVANTIAYIESQSYTVDTNEIVLMGHSYGGGVVLNTINESCPFPLCQDPAVLFPQGVTVPRHPGIILGSAYGSSLNNQGDFAAITNLDIPYGIINGDGDINFFADLNGENLTTGSFARLNPTKVIATISNLDHFSIADAITSPDRGDVLSTLPRAQQTEKVVKAVSFWLKMNLKDNPTDDFCNQLQDRGLGEEGGVTFLLTDCLEDYA